MLLAIDVGNTNSVFSVSKNREIISEWRCSTDGNMTSDQYFMATTVVQHSWYWLQKINKVIVSSVVSDSIFNLKLLSKKYFNCVPLLAQITVKSLYPLMLKRSKCWCWQISKRNSCLPYYWWWTIIVDFGTATTFDVINEAGSYIGGVIAPGVALSTKAAWSRCCFAARKVKRPRSVVGRNTITCTIGDLLGIFEFGGRYNF